MAKCKSCGQYMDEEVNFCSNCGTSSITGKETMAEESIYTDEIVKAKAEEVAEQLREMPKYMMSSYFTYVHDKGPLGVFSKMGHLHADALTMKQRNMVIKIVGKGMTQIGKDNKKEAKINKKFMKEPMPIKHGMSRSELADAKEQGRIDAIFRAIEMIKK